MHDVHYDLVGQSVGLSHGDCVCIWPVDDSGNDFLISPALSDWVWKDQHHLRGLSEGLSFTAAVMLVLTSSSRSFVSNILKRFYSFVPVFVSLFWFVTMNYTICDNEKMPSVVFV